MCQTPAFVNPSAGGADPVLRVLRDDARVSVRITPPESLVSELADAVARGAETVVVAGGDGTLATAAASLVGSETALGVVPAGTLNHFAHDRGLPLDPAAALEVALGGRRAAVDAAFVDERPFLNTSAVGAYVAYVRTRERWEGRLGYYGASLLAAVGTFVRLRSVALELAVEGEVRSYRSPLVFIGVGERELRPATLGARAKDGRRGLHVLIVKHAPRLRLLGRALRTLLRGTGPWGGTRWRAFWWSSSPSHGQLRGVGWRWTARSSTRKEPLAYSYRRDALTVRVPEPST